MKTDLSREYQTLKQDFDDLKLQNLSLNMARGKPGKEQLELSMPLLDVLNSGSDCLAADGTDCRNYGGLEGIIDARKLFSEYLEVSPEEIMITGSSSLIFMYDTISRAMLTGVLGSKKPWSHYDRPKFICPVPGYDRHFSICEFLGIEMLPVTMDDNGPNMELVEELVKNDETIKGIWCVPKYSNPSGITYSDETVHRLAAMETKAEDFRIFWDQAYAYHFLDPNTDTVLLNLLEACKKAGHPNRAYLFASTNKITFPGAGVAFFAASEENIAYAKKQLSMQAISWDKLNMLRHVRFFKNMSGIHNHMCKHATLLKPRFYIVMRSLEKELLPLGLGTYTKPQGGYFITYMAPHGCAKRIVALCKEVGITLTDAGATYPYGNDPDDSCIRIAPSFPSCKELETAMNVFCKMVRLAAVEKQLKE